MKRLMMASVAVLGLCTAACGTSNEAGNTAQTNTATAANEANPTSPDGRHYLSQPLVREIFTADPSAHVWPDGKLYIYPSHDVPTDTPNDDLGNQYAMRDYRVLRMDEPGGKVTIGPVALDVKDVPWASQQMWAPDAAYKDGTYYLYFPARDKSKDRNGLGAFRIGVATSKNPMGPFKAEPEAIPGSFSMDPAVYQDTDGTAYMYFGGIWGGQIQR